MFKPLKRAAFFVSQVFTAEWNWMSVCANKDASLTLDDATLTMDGAGAGNVQGYVSKSVSDLIIHCL